MNPLQLQLQHKQRGWVALSTQALLPTEATELRWLDHEPPVRGKLLDTAEVSFGVYGHNAQREAARFASVQAGRTRGLGHTLVLWYEVKGCGSTSLPASFAETSGFLVLSRIAARFRAELHERFVEKLTASQRPSRQASKLSKLPLWELLAKEPWLVQQLLLERKDLDIIVHSAYTDWSPSSLLCIASFKVKTERIKAMEVRYQSDLRLRLQ